MANHRGKRRRSGRGAAPGRPTAGASSPALAPDELVFGNAQQLRQMAETLRRGDPAARGRAASASASRVRAFRQRHPDAELDQLVHRPICEDTDAGDQRPDARSGRVVVNATGDGPVEIWVDGYITNFAYWEDEVSSRAIRDALDQAGDRDVLVHMNSGGGDYFEGVAIYRALRDYSAAGPDVYVAVDALAASAASVVAMGGDTVGIGDGAFIMVHQASAFAYGNADDLVSTAKMLEVIDGEIAGFYARKASGTAAEWADAMAAETWYGPDAAVEAGLADERLDTSEAAPVDDAVAAAFHPDVFRPAAVAETPPPDPDPDPAPTADADVFASVFDIDALDLEELMA